MASHQGIGNPQILIAAQIMRAGGVVAYPTEAVWGLGADPFNYRAVEYLLDLKQRPMRKGLILVAANMGQLDFLLDGLRRVDLAKLQMSWPGPNTWLIPHLQRVPSWISGDHETVAVRVSAHPVVKALCERFGGPIVSTSANPQGLAPAQQGYRARAYFGADVFYVPGQVDLNARPSVIRDLQTDRVLRA